MEGGKDVAGERGNCGRKGRTWRGKEGRRLTEEEDCVELKGKTAEIGKMLRREIKGNGVARENGPWRRRSNSN